MIKILAFGLFMSVFVAGCGPREPEVFLSETHPAVPSSASGKQFGAPAALRPELQKATPRLPTIRRSSLLSPSRPLTRPRMQNGMSHGEHKMPMEDSK